MIDFSKGWAACVENRRWLAAFVAILFAATMLRLIDIVLGFVFLLWSLLSIFASSLLPLNGAIYIFRLVDLVPGALLSNGHVLCAGVVACFVATLAYVLSQFLRALSRRRSLIAAQILGAATCLALVLSPVRIDDILAFWFKRAEFVRDIETNGLKFKVFRPVCAEGGFGTPDSIAGYVYDATDRIAEGSLAQAARADPHNNIFRSLGGHFYSFWTTSTTCGLPDQLSAVTER